MGSCCAVKLPIPNFFSTAMHNARTAMHFWRTRCTRGIHHGCTTFTGSALYTPRVCKAMAKCSDLTNPVQYSALLDFRSCKSDAQSTSLIQPVHLQYSVGTDSSALFILVAYRSEVYSCSGCARAYCTRVQKCMQRRILLPGTLSYECAYNVGMSRST